MLERGLVAIPHLTSLTLHSPFCIEKLNILLRTELDERMRDLKNELEGYNTGDSDEINKKKAIDALKRMENWNLFRDTKEVRPVYMH